MAASPLSNTVCGDDTKLAAQLQQFESRLDALQEEAAACGAAATDFATLATDRITALEADMHRLSAATDIKSGLVQPFQATFYPFGTLDNLAELLLSAARREVLQVIEDTLARLALLECRCAAAERGSESAAGVARAAAAAVGRLEGRMGVLECSTARSAEQFVGRLAALEAEAAGRGVRHPPAPCGPAADAAATSGLLQERLLEGCLEQCAGLVDAARGAGTGGASGAGLAALRDLVEALESVAARVTSLETAGAGPLGAAWHAGALQTAAPALPGNLPHQVHALEHVVAAMRSELNESVSALWSAVQDISHEVHTGGSNTTATADLATSSTDWFLEASVLPPLPSFQPPQGFPS
uniref:Uncharacterized protein n=1 Tax=Pyrodinium bahamense TaxID=73915 RepID=A0A7S0AL00_9DINO|mmetsp:Transcript_36970/g.102729  ORF Transcript_36970/g.102729 Transcript_36970/m.102729 type:complete len:356 (+) Transcript_36970:68-1135(+)